MTDREPPRLALPTVTWTWYVFGKSQPPCPHLMVIVLNVPVPLWRRVLTRVFFGSVWERA